MPDGYRCCVKTAQSGGNWFLNNSIISQTVRGFLVLVTKNAVFVRLVAFYKRLLKHNLRRRGRKVCTEAQINRVLKAMVECYRAVYGDEIVLSPTVIPYDEFVKYRQTLPYYKNIAREGRKIG